MARFRALAAVVAAVLLPTAAWGQAYPHWSSDQVRAARPLAAEPALSFDVRTTTTRADRAAETVTRTVTLAASFTDIATGGAHTLEDHDLCRTLAWSSAAAVMENASCYAAPGFRVYELGNRAKIAEVLRTTDAKAVMQEPYWYESELGLQVEAGDPAKARKTGAGVEYRLGDTVVARVEGAVGPLSAEELRWLNRYLARQAPVHPQVRRGVAQGGVLPERVETVYGQIAKNSQVLVFSNLRRGAVAYPLPADLGAAIREAARTGKDARAAALRTTLAALDGQPVAPKPTLRALVDRIRVGRPMAAYMAFNNLTQQYGAALQGPGGEALLAEIRPPVLAALRDPDVARFHTASGLAGDAKMAGDRAAAARYLAGASALDAIPFGTFRYVTYANLREGSQADGAPEPGMPSRRVDNYWLHLAAYPWAANAWNDLGDAYLGAYETPDAWLAYDLGRAIDPDWRSSIMAAIADRLETSLRRRAPDFF